MNAAEKTGSMGFIAVILAAGKGSRAGAYKPLLTLGNGVVIDRVIQAAQDVCNKIIVVGGYDFERLCAHLRAYHPGVMPLFNPSWEQGMFTSVQAGVSGLNTPAFIHPADIPGVSVSVYRDLAAAFAQKSADIFRPVYRGRAGHPVLVAPSVFSCIVNAPPDTTMRDIQKTLHAADVEVPDQWICRDFDTREEFETLRKELLPV